MAGVRRKNPHKSLKKGDKVRVFFLGHPEGVVTTIIRTWNEGIAIGVGSSAFAREYSFELIRNIEKNGLNPFIVREENGIERANRILKGNK